MTKYYYSPQTNGFYLDDLHSFIPADKMEITKTKYESLLSQISGGMRLGVENGVVVAKAITVVTTWEDIRVKRDSLLTNSDWTQLEDAPIAAEKKVEWATYRAALRDITTAFPNPDAVVWPTKPT